MLLFIKYYYSDQIKGHEMGSACGTMAYGQMASSCGYVNESLGSIKCREHLDWLRYRDIILYGNLHYFSLEPFLMMAGNAALATVPVCNALGSAHFSLLCYG